MSKTAPKELLSELSGISDQATMLAETVARFGDMVFNISCSITSMKGSMDRMPLKEVSENPELSSIFQSLVSVDNEIKEFIFSEEKELKNVLNLSKKTLKSVKEICE